MLYLYKSQIIFCLQIDSDEYKIQMLYNATIIEESIQTMNMESTTMSDELLMDRHKSSLSQCEICYYMRLRYVLNLLFLRVLCL